ncbi:histone deacetylase 9-B isoform X2 [Maylandia zebra]|uniref:histone deacetylase 9-B isoform X2 n=1 Tax=Maylandia zebra TaxID=106582 RepID=UPI000329DCC2|nr:histone deacetylase 9 isoform X2 [Maylandia zebra]XP_005934796.1 histone deacetylase 9-B isoform X2 [Haplochromis burtoni]XP_026041710.1 histone deacetylase 9 isoform X2 [Astatotilapia calliptera]XP_039887026.1 histone deacetylase 9-B isoform X2 [Simochromis diagramma]
MLQTIYEGESSFSITEGRVGHQQFPNPSKMHNVNNSVDIKPDVPLAVEPLSPLDLRTDLRMLGPGSDPGLWERQLQQELLLIQKQQQIQKQLLISEFQKQHEKLTRQHQAQLQEHLKLQQELQAMKQQQELAEKERRLEQQQQQQSQQEKEQEKHRREHHISSLSLRGKERSRESAVASTEVKQKLQEFLLSKSAKDSASNGANHSFIQHPKLWYTSSHHTSLDQSSPPLGGTSPTCQYTLPSPVESKDDFPLRKTASEPNLKVRSRLKQKVAERRSSPMLKRRDGNIMTPYKKRALELMDSTPTNSAPGSGPSSPIGASSALGAENGPSSLPTTTKTERWPSQPRLFRPEGSVPMLSLYTSPSLPNISLGLSTASSPISAAMGLKDRSTEIKHGLPGHLLGPVPLQTGLESKVSPSHQALLQHLLQKEQMRQQKILSSGQGSMSSHSQSPLAMKDRPSSTRPKLPKHRPLNRTQSAPLPQNTLAQLVIQQQHQHFLEKQKQYQQQVHINKLLSKSIEQLRQPSAHLQESEEEQEEQHREEVEGMQEDRLPPGGVIRKHTLSSSSSGSSSELPDTHYGVIKVKEEPADSEDEALTNQSLESEQSTYLHQVKGRLVIRAMI